jgi:hypothetical protein
MQLEQVLTTSIDEFKQNMLNFCKNEDLNPLTPETACHFVSVLKGQLQELGTKAIQAYFESHDIEQANIEHEGERYLRKYKGNKVIMTMLGKVAVNRNVYQHARGGKSLAPLDMALGVKGEYIMPDVKEVVLFSSAHNTPEETAQIIKKCSLFELHPTTIKRAIENAGVLIEEHKESIRKNVNQAVSKQENTGEVVVCSMDGVNVLLNETGKKKGRPAERPVKDRAPNVSAYKNAMCGSISYYKKVDINGKASTERESSKYIARMPEERYSMFKAEFEEQVRDIKRQNIQPRVKILITDAHKSIMGYLGNNPLFDDFERLIDYYHAAEHLSLLSEAIFGKSCEKAREWYLKYASKLKYSKDGSAQLIRSASYYTKKNKLSKERLKEAQKHVNYFKRNGKYMEYHRFIENGWPIGSGVIEAACKSVVKQRMCRSGQRWSRKGGQSILSLRAYVKSGEWEEFWNSYYQLNYKKCA